MLKTRMAAGETLVGTFLKTPAHELIEVLAKSKLDFITLDGEHAPFDRARMDLCLAMANALGVPALVRVPTGTPVEILKALDSGASGVIVPHVTSVAMAQEISRAARYGHGGRGYAGTTRFGGFGTMSMPEVIARNMRETIVIAQIEEPEAVEIADEIAAVEGIDGIFVGPADLAICYGTTNTADTVVQNAMRKVGLAAKAHNKTYMTFAANAGVGASLRELGVTMFFVASEHAFMLHGANAAADAFHQLP